MPARAMSRIMSRTIPCDPVLKEVLYEFLTKKRSISKLISCSVYWQQVFESVQKRMTDPVLNRTLKDLRYAKQRIDSLMAPAGRCIILLEALLMTAIRVSLERKGKPEAAEADAFLQFVNEERIMMLALWADSGAETLRLTRYLDSEHYDIGTMASEIDSYLARINALFIDGSVVDLGYTQTARKWGGGGSG